MANPIIEEIIAKRKKEAVRSSIEYIDTCVGASDNVIRAMVARAALLDAEINNDLYESLPSDKQKEYAKIRMQVLTWKLNTWAERM